MRKADGVVLSIAGTVVLGNGEGFTLEGLAVNDGRGESSRVCRPGSNSPSPFPGS